MNAPAVLLGRFEHDSPEWHEARKARLGGSEIAAVLGLSKFESEFGLWHRKQGTGLPDETNDEMRAGTMIEPVVLEWFQRQRPDLHLVRDAGTWVHPVRDWQLANPDGIAWVPGETRPAGLVEAKFAIHADEWGPTGTDRIPVYYRCQVQWYLDVLGLEVAWLSVFIGSCAEFRTYEIPADPADQATLRAEGVRFMRSLHAGVRPSIDGHDATYQTVRNLHPQINGEKLKIDEHVARDYCLAKAAEKAAIEDARRATATLADIMGDYQKAVYEGQTIASRQAKGNGLPYLVAGRSLPTFEESNGERNVA